MSKLTKSLGISGNHFLVWRGGSIIAVFVSEADCDEYINMAHKAEEIT